MAITINRTGTARNASVWIYGASALIFVVTAWFSIGYNHPDEHFQILEFAGFKLGMNPAADLPWEYGFAMRPAFQPFIAWSVYSVSSFIGMADPFLVTFFLRLLNAAITFLSIHLVVKLYSPTLVHRGLATPFLLLSFLLFFVVYNSARFSSDTLSGRLFIIAFALLFLRQKRDLPVYFFTGFLLGIAFITRYQVIFMIAGFSLWLMLIKKEGIRNLAMLALGFLTACGIGILCDRWFYGRWEFTFWNYFRQNILLDKVSGFGLSPWYDYFTQTFLNAIPPLSLIFILAVLVYFMFRPKDPVTWSIVPFLAVHFAIGHKELRFLYPIIGFIPFMMIAVWDRLLEIRGETLAKNLFIRIFAWIFWSVNFLMVAVIMFRPADDCAPVFREIMNAPPGPMVLYYDQSDPYQLCYNIYFYRRPGMVTRKIDSPASIPDRGDSLTYFVTTRPPDFRGADGRRELVYYALPEWMKRFDYNGWIERTRFWRIYRIG